MVLLLDSLLTNLPNTLTTTHARHRMMFCKKRGVQEPLEPLREGATSIRRIAGGGNGTRCGEQLRPIRVWARKADQAVECEQTFAHVCPRNGVLRQPRDVCIGEI